MSKPDKACAPMQLILQGPGQIYQSINQHTDKNISNSALVKGIMKSLFQEVHLSCALSAEQMMIVPSGGQGSSWREACRGHRRTVCCHGEGAVPGAHRLVRILILF